MASRVFRDRADAGRQLGRALTPGWGGKSPLVLAIPRGGAVVGAAVARALGGRLDVLICRKVGAPANPEAAVGAVGPGGALWVDPRGRQHAAPAYVAEAAEQARREVADRSRRLRGNRPPPAVAGQVVILVDDGIATGATVQVALEWLRRQGPAELILAVPVAAADSLDRLRPLADQVVCLLVPDEFWAVGQFYADFRQTEDAEVLALLREFPG